MAEEKKQLGKILLSRKLVSPEALDDALREQTKSKDPKPLASHLTEKGIVTEEDALRALSEQFGVPGIDLSQVAILLEHLDALPRDHSSAKMMLPVLVRGDRLFMAMANPADKRVIDELEFVSGKKVYAYVALTGPLQRAIAASYDAKAQGETYYLGPNVPQETLDRLGQGGRTGATPPPQTMSSPTRPPVKAPALRRTDAPPHVAPEAPRGVVDQSMAAVSARAEMSSETDFGSLASDISQLTPDPKPALDPVSEPPTLTRDAKLILVVDDEEDIRKLLRRVLTENGHRVIEADRGLLALRLVKEHVPDLIVLDAMLPELHGFDIARRIKGSEKYGQIPIIMISAVYRGWRIAEDLKNSYGIEAYIEKPFRIADVVAAATRALAMNGKRQSDHPPRDPEQVSAEAEKALADGVAAYKAGNIDQAIAHLLHGVTIDPLAYRLHFHLALLYGKKGSIYEGIQELEKSIELNPKHFPALKNLAILYEKAGFRHKAVEMWERCVHLAPDVATRAQVKEHLISLLG
jgi:DNA-binding response OmpR family regulator